MQICLGLVCHRSSLTENLSPTPAFIHREFKVTLDVTCPSIIELSEFQLEFLDDLIRAVVSRKHCRHRQRTV